MAQYITSCPVGCDSGLESTPMTLPEGPLLKCPDCGQLISQATEERYRESMMEFDDPKGTLPDAASQGRRFSLGKKWLDKISSLLGKPPAEIRLLDVGCSSGAFLQIAKTLGFAAEGVEPAPRAAQAAKDSGLIVHCGYLQDIGFPPES
ncbi:MAG: class I SAM-dependent methyltransferase, partial [Burkholderiales bacterium]